MKPGGKIALFEYTLAPNEKFSKLEMKMLDLVIEGSAMMGLKDFRHDQFTGPFIKVCLAFFIFLGLRYGWDVLK
ncbi:hypothetical protein CVV26_01095 [Candidatus Kuenenbacteria bacterium HGW-Kuenenbacteria-1]|uniref:Uncharacterized protein n=1 Tax=Candidatus Kuenenbacteria bacterium HGW-Kuenenbacteria-1 TaxID=2013812 RepID=A0A2N1UP05_9BACT|nr:MAG: hypothetical protein CVV26_01095 [Candidatus Kuenenbacteria bacterium HGW-Kuenenbacteria-1]